MTWHAAAGMDALPVARLLPLVRDTSHPAPGLDLLALRNWAARLLKAAAEAAGAPCHRHPIYGHAENAH
ncbi:hypothetical protein GCM10012286_62400 [Streptomyces lasiicapitis]|uniref:Uncharacterized protein n=1 Tax=Streptomyces lasiicapitis TaxID=1923961 RepID=A0ABQ2MK96_9ACTN|nr:hypothetical protein GCM10012286_62400 [Streptomyces lasiicapitis]